MKSLIILSLLIIIPEVMIAQQSIDLFTFSGRYGLPQSYKENIDGEATEKGTFLNLVAPVKFNDNTIWYNSLNHFYWHVSNNLDTPPEIANPVNLHGILLRTGLVQKFGNGRGIQLILSPRLMSDFINISSNHYQFGGMAIYEKKFHDELSMGFGLLYNQEYFGPYFVPLVNLNWTISSRWSIAGLLPIYAKINYRINDRFVAGISHFGLITTYRLSKDEYKDDYIERSSIDLSLFGRYKLFGNLYIEGRIGHTLGRSYEQYASDQKVDFGLPLLTFGDNREAKNVNFKDGIILDLRIVFNIPIPE